MAKLTVSKRLFSTLNGRLTLALFVSFLSVGVFTAILLICSSRAYQQEVAQVMHKDLAAHVVGHYLLFEHGSPNLDQAKSTFHDLMILGPNFEFYLLDTSGRIVAYSTDPAKIKRQTVNLSPINTYLNKGQIENTVYGDDPRNLDREKVFSVAPIMHKGQLQGYLYVILGSEIYDHIADLIWGSKIIQWGLWVFASGLVFGLIATLWLTGLITRPLTRLTNQIQAIQSTGFSKDPLNDGVLINDLKEWDIENPDEMHTLGRAFKQALEKLSEQYQNVVTIDELRKELLSHVSHDLRTPLASLLGYLETWELNQDKLSREDSQKFIATAKKSAQTISSLVEQLFELAHLDGGNVQVNKERFAIAELVGDVLQKFNIAAQQKNISLNVTPQDSSIKVVGDIEKLDRVFTNLIENSLRHTKAGGSITVRLSGNPQNVAVEVSDTGIGIPVQDLPFVFDPHYKAGNSVRENTAHGGLGLAITKKLLDLHQSTISVSSKINQGTKFQFALPAGT